MKKRIFIMGQCTLHWGRMEFGNIGNYYILKPMFEQLRRVFKNAQFVTTMQLSKEFCKKFGVEVVPMELYYDFESEDNLALAKSEYLDLCEGKKVNSEYIIEVRKADLVIDFSGDIWGDNANFLGKDRFITGLYKDLIAQLLKPTVMIAGSPGPFDNCCDIEFVKKVFSGFKLVTNRENISTKLLNKQNFDMNNVKNYACPSFLFEQASQDEVSKKINIKEVFLKDNLKIGIILCGWNFKRGPFDAWPRDVVEYDNFVNAIKNINEKYNIKIYLLSHSNGFDISPKPFALKHGRDYPIMEQFSEILKKEKIDAQLFNGVYSPEETKGIISNFDILISGRMHGAVAGISQCIPTVIIDYGHEPKAHKLKGFAEITGMQDYLADPNDLQDLIDKIQMCIENRKKLHDSLVLNIPKIKKNAKEQFDLLKQFVEE